VYSVDEVEVVKATFVLDGADRIWSEETLTKGPDYTITRDSTTGLGSVTLTEGPLEQDFRLALRRITPAAQQVDIKNAGPYNPRTHETALDRLAYISQMVQEDNDRSLKLHITDNDPAFDTTLPPGAPDNQTATLMVNADGDAFEWGPNATDLEDAALRAAEAEAAKDAAAASAAAAAASASDAGDSATEASEAAAQTEGIQKRIVLARRPIWPSDPYDSNTDLQATGQVAYCDTSGGGFTVTLPQAATMDDVRVVVKKVTGDGNALVVEAYGSETIDGELNVTVQAPFGWVMLISDGVEWHVIG
jgi:hypothetical protein